MEIQQWLYDKGLVGIHYEDKCSIEPNDYKKKDGDVIRRYVDLASTGGYICAEYPAISKMIVGTINPDNTIECIKDKYCIKSIKISKPKRVSDGMRLRLRSGAPRQGTLSHWIKIEDRLEQLLFGNIRNEWGWLTPDEQEVVCQEYMRTEMKSQNRLQHLILPIGRTLKDVDIYGITETGKELYAQVTYSRDKAEIEKKVKALQQYKGILIFFCPKSFFQKENSIKFIATEDVEKWLLSNNGLSDMIFGQIN